MMWEIIEYAATLIECIISADFICRFLSYKDKQHYLISFSSITALDFLITFTLNQFTIFEGTLGFARIIANLLIVLLFMQGSLFEKILVCTMTDVALLIISFISLNAFSIIFKRTIAELIEMSDMIRLIILFVSKFVFFLFTRLMLCIRKKDKYTLSLLEWIVLMVIFIITVCAEMKIFTISVEYKFSAHESSVIMVGIGLFLIDVLVYILMIRMSRKNAERTQLMIDRMQFDVYKEKLDEMEKQYDEIKAIRHDMKNHLQCILALIKKGKNNESQEYVEDILNNKLYSEYEYINTESNIINVIANYKLSVCKNSNIKTVVNISSFKLDVDDYDICIILGNLFDNAIEACNKIKDEKIIFFEISQKKGYVNFVIKNSIETSVLQTNPHLRTNKSNSAWHGLGLKSVKETVSKYDGMMDFYENSNLFVADVWIPSKKIK